MKKEAEKLNAHAKATFQIYDGERIPFAEASFDWVLAVNTIYFWTNPEKLFQEIGRVLKPKGLCIVTYGAKHFLKDLPFVKTRFRLYDRTDISSHIAHSNLEIIKVESRTEKVQPGDFKREYEMVRLVKRGAARE